MELAARFAGDDATVVRAKTLRSRLSELADEVAGLAEQVRSRLRSAVVGDAEAAVELARAASRVARRLADLNA